jgi:hypothetical protein
MAQDKLYGGFSQLPTWAKGVVAVVGVSIIAGTTFVIYKSIKNAIIKAQGNSSSSEEAKDDLKDLRNQGVKPNYPDAQYEVWAEQLHQAMKFTFTDEDAVYRIFNFLKNDADVLKVIQVYGLRPEVGTTLTTWFDTDMTLAQQIASAMSTSEIVKINNGFRAKGIKFRF